MSGGDRNLGEPVQRDFSEAGAGLDAAVQAIARLQRGPAGCVRGTRVLLGEAERRITAALLWLQTAHSSCKRGLAVAATGEAEDPAAPPCRHRPFQARPPYVLNVVT